MDNNKQVEEQEEDINDHFNLNDKEREEYSMMNFEENYIKKASEKINELIMSKVILFNRFFILFQGEKFR